jgi:predicted metal-dependent HD superfamily phosphohydrolase
MDFEVVKDFVLDKLSNNLHENLTYHCVEHTLDVIESAERLAKLEGVNGHDLQLIKTAALMHDLGFLESYKGHEDISIRMVGELLPNYGYSAEDIKKIQGMIKSTEIPQNPTNKLEEIIADADLDYLGRDDLFLIGQRLQYEWKMHGIVSTLKEWHEKQLAFLKAHRYYTQAAKKLRTEKKMENIDQLERLLCLKK